MPDPEVVPVENLLGGWSDSDPTIIDDNQLAKGRNWYYDERQILTTRRGTAVFGDEVADIDNQHSIYFSKFSNGDRHLLCAMTTATDTTIYEYNETTGAWDSLKTGLTKDLRLSFVTYKDEIYWTNGTDNVMSYDGTTVSEHAAVEKGKYLVMFNDVAYMCGIGDDPSTIFYTDTYPTDLKSSFPYYVVVEEDNGQSITGVTYQAGLLLVGKDSSIHSFEVTGDTLDVLDYSGGVEAHRSWTRVDNDSLYLSARGVFSLTQRRGTTGSLRSTPLTNALQGTIRGVGNFSIACAFYSERNSNYYLSIDQDASGKNKGILVRNTVVGQYKPDAGWTNYTGINANDICEYEDADGDYHILIANVFGGQCIEMETGYNDQGNSIRCELHLKEFDLGDPSKHKTFPFVDFNGLSSAGVEATFKLLMGDTVRSKTFTASDYIDFPEAARALGIEELGTYPIGAGPTDEGIPTEDFDIRVNAGYHSARRIQPKVEATILNSKLQIRKLSIAVLVHPVDVFPPSLII